MRTVEQHEQTRSHFSLDFVFRDRTAISTQYYTTKKKKKTSGKRLYTYIKASCTGETDLQQYPIGKVGYTSNLVCSIYTPQPAGWCTFKMNTNLKNNFPACFDYVSYETFSQPLWMKRRARMKKYTRVIDLDGRVKREEATTNGNSRRSLMQTDEMQIGIQKRKNQCCLESSTV